MEKFREERVNLVLKALRLRYMRDILYIVRQLLELRNVIARDKCLEGIN